MTVATGFGRACHSRSSRPSRSDSDTETMIVTAAQRNWVTKLLDKFRDPPSATFTR
jgi:hypothetical protein